MKKNEGEGSLEQLCEGQTEESKKILGKKVMEERIVLRIYEEQLKL